MPMPPRDTSVTSDVQRLQQLVTDLDCQATRFAWFAGHRYSGCTSSTLTLPPLCTTAATTSATTIVIEHTTTITGEPTHVTAAYQMTTGDWIQLPLQGDPGLEGNVAHFTVPVITEEQRMQLEQWNAQQREREARMQQVLAEEQQQLQRANRRALVLLLTVLSTEQRAEFKATKAFHVIGGKTKTRYRIRTGIIANIDVYTRHQRIAHRLCAHPEGPIPFYDVMVGQALSLQDARTEEDFVRRANVHPLVHRPDAIAALAA
jgi:hypothetical protein